MITPQNIARHELIGLGVAVEESTDPSLKGVSGTVIGETRNTIRIMAKKREVVLAKANCTFVFGLPDGKRVRVEGRVLVGRPEDRIKKKQEKW